MATLNAQVDVHEIAELTYAYLESDVTWQELDKDERTYWIEVNAIVAKTVVEILQRELQKQIDAKDAEDEPT